MENRGWWIFLIILIVALGGAIAVIIAYRFFLNPNEVETVVCTSDNQCDLGSFCNTDGVCEITTCTTDSDCKGSQSCIGSYCIEKACNIQSDCASGETCYNGECVLSGETCDSTLDCNNGTLPCIGGVCRQCQINSDCPNGFCDSTGKCVNNCDGKCGSGEVCVINTIQVCCDNTAGNCGQYCEAQGQGACKYCVNNMLTCKQGATSAFCTVDDDCISGKCLIGTPMGNVCSYVGSDECIANYQPGMSNTYMCDSKLPYCVNGTCNSSPLGAVCGTDKNNTCRTANKNVSDPTSTTINTDVASYSYYCVNNICRMDPGSYGEVCSVDNDCVYVQGATNSSQERLRCINGKCA